MNKPKLTAALALGATVGLGLALIQPAHADDKSKQQHTVSSKDYAKYLKAAQDAQQKGQYQEALAQLDKARALPKPTGWDTHLINTLSVYPYVKTGNVANAAKALEALTSDGFSEPSEVNRDINNLATLYYQMKNYGKAIEFGNRAINAGSADSQTYLVVSQSYYLKGDYKDARHFLEDQVSKEIKQGGTPTEDQLRLIQSSCTLMGDKPCETHAFERLVTYYPKPDYWENLVLTLFQSHEAAESDIDTLNIYRLADDVAAVTKAPQYLEMAQLALEQGSPGEAQHALEEGYAKNAFTDPHDKEKAQRVLASAKKRAAEDQAALPKLAAEAQSSASGEGDVGVGIAYLGYRQYDKAADALAQGLMKGGVKEEAQARLLLGIAQLKSGKRDDAVKTFHMVAGDPTLVRLANLWSLRARSASGTVAQG
jgi:tetratricopeptide (TPR) repeat protein